MLKYKLSFVKVLTLMLPRFLAKNKECLVRASFSLFSFSFLFLFSFSFRHHRRPSRRGAPALGSPQTLAAAVDARALERVVKRAPERSAAQPLASRALKRSALLCFALLSFALLCSAMLSFVTFLC